MKHIKTLLCIGLASALGATVWVATPADAEARNQSGMLGSADVDAESVCFDEADGGVKRIAACTGNRGWVVPLVVDSSGTLNIDVLVKGAGNGGYDVGCTAFSFTSSGLVSSQDYDVTQLTTNAWEHLNLSIYAQGSGASFLRCTMGPDTRLLHVNY